MAVTEFSCRACGCTMRSTKQIQPGAMVRCPKCGLVFKFADDADASPAEAPKPAAVKPSPPPTTKPPAKKTSIASTRADERPAISRRRPDDDDDRELDRPTRRRRRKGNQGGNNIAIFAAAGVAVFLFVVIGLGAVGYVVFGSKKKSSDTNVASNVPAAQLPPTGGFRPTEPTVKPPSNPTLSTKPETPASEPTVAPRSPTSAGSVQDVYDYVLKSTTLIVNVMQNGAALGTGSVIDANDRLILTNFHVVANTAKLIVFFPTYEGGKLVSEKERYLGSLKNGGTPPENLIQGEVVATDTMRDLALIRVPKLPPGTETLPLAKGMVNIGQIVHSVGNPGASGALWVYTQGAVRSVYRHKWKAAGGDLLLTLDAEIIETQSPTNHGDSGGPLVNDRGELVGVTEGGSTEGHLISTFISLNEARDFIEREYQRKFGKPWRPLARSPLRTRGGSSGADVTALISALDSKDAKSRASAARSLGEIGPDAKLAIRRLVAALKDPDDLTRRASAEALTKIGAPGRDDLPVLIDALKDPKPEVRRYVSGAIGQIGPEAASAADQLVEALSDDDERVRESVVRSLGNLGSNAKAAAIPGLIKALKDSNKAVRVAAASAMTNLLTPPTAADVPLFVTILKLQDPEARVFGARALAKLGKDGKAAMPDLLEAAKSTDPGVRRGAIDSLAAIGPDAKAVAPVYLAALKDASESGVRQSALHALGQLGKDLGQDKDAVAAMLAAVNDNDKQVKKAALAAVGKVGSAIGAPGAKQIMPTLIDALLSKEADMRDQALETVAGIGPLGRDAVPTLITMMEKQDVKLFKDKTNKIFIQDADDAFLDRIAKTLGKVGLPAVKLLVASLNTTNVNAGLFIGSCRALGEVGPPAKQAVGALRFISQSNLPPPVCFEADRALRKIQSK